MSSKRKIEQLQTLSNELRLDSYDKQVGVGAKIVDDKYLIVTVINKELRKIFLYALTLDASSSLVAMSASDVHSGALSALMEQIEAREQT